MTSLKDRQRAAARQRLEREMAERVAACSRRRKQTLHGARRGRRCRGRRRRGRLDRERGRRRRQEDRRRRSAPSVGAGQLHLDAEPEPDRLAGAAGEPGPEEHRHAADHGQPGHRHPGHDDEHQRGKINIALDVTNAPCASESFAYLASKKYFDNTTCHRLTTSGIYVLQCGDPTGTGSGGPSYTFGHENLPTDKRPDLRRRRGGDGQPG